MNVQTAWKRLLGAYRETPESVSTVPDDGPATAVSSLPFRQAFEHLPVAMAVLGPDLRFLSVNTAMCRLFGYSRAELESRTVIEITHPLDVGRTRQMAQRLFAGELPWFKLEKRYRTPAGDIWCESIVTLVRDANGAVLSGLAMVQDITERIRIEQALRSSFEFRDRVMQAATNAIAALDAEGNFILANHRVTEISGYDAEELIGHSLRPLLPEGEVARVEAHLQAALTRSQPVSNVETKILRKDGQTRTVCFSLQPLLLENGEPGVVGTAEDITERKCSEHALRQSEDRHRDLVEHGGVLIGLHDLDGRILNVNQSLFRLAGYQRADEMVGTSISDLLSPAVRHLFPAYLEQIRTQGQASGLMKTVTREGEEKIVEYHNSLRQEGLASPIVRCFGHDVTERVRGAKALRASEIRYRALYEDNPAMYFTVDPAGIILSVNQFGAEQLGYRPSDLVGQSVLDVFHPDDRAEVCRQMAITLEDPGALAHWEFRKLHKDGTVLWVREVARATTSPQGDTELLVVCEDVTEQRQIEQALQDSEARLRALSDNLPNGAVFQIVSEPDGDIHFPYLSAGIKQLVGVAADDAMRNATLLTDLILEEDLPRLRAALEQSMRSLTVFDIEVRMQVRTDLIKWIHCRSAPRRLPDNGTLWDGVLVDVTDAHRDLERLLQTLGAIVWEAEGDLDAASVDGTFTSQQAERVLGYPLSEWLTPGFWLKHMHPEDRAGVLARRQQAIHSQENFELDYRMFTQDGRTLWVRDIINVVARGNGRIKLQGIMVDVTESKRAEIALRESEERFRTLAETMPAALLIYRGENWVYANPAAERITGYTRDELQRMKIWHLVHPKSQPLARERVERRQRGEAIPARGEFCLLTRDGNEYWIEVTGTPIVFQGQPSVLVTGFDITERTRAENALRESKEALRLSHERVQDLAGKLMLAQEDERRRISRELHDDLNQKVAALAISMSRLKQDLPDAPVQVRDQLGGLQSRLLGLSDDVRQLSHQLHPAALEHTGLVAALKSHCADFSNQEGISVALSIRDVSDSIPADMSLCLYRIAQESLRNIARHAQTSEAQVTLAATPEAISLSVADPGVGFDPEYIRQKGGLGLVSMEERVRLLRGILQIRTQPEGGTELHVVLPFGH